jgi:hypothetical protein
MTTPTKTMTRTIQGICTGWLRFTPGRDKATLLVLNATGREVQLVGPRSQVDVVQRAYKNQQVKLVLDKGTRVFTVTAVNGSGPQLEMQYLSPATPDDEVENLA